MRPATGRFVSAGVDDPVDGAAALGAGLAGADLAGAGGLDREPELLLERAADGAADRVVLPTGGRSDLLDRGALGTLEQLDHERLLGAGARGGLAGRLTVWLAGGGRRGVDRAVALGQVPLRRHRERGLRRRGGRPADCC